MRNDELIRIRSNLAMTNAQEKLAEIVNLDLTVPICNQHLDV